MVLHQPQNIEEICGIVSDACVGGAKLEITGGGTRDEFGAPNRAADRLSVKALSGILDYDPAELVLTARAGTPLAELNEAVAARGQAFAFEPWGDAGSTIGGVVAAGVAGPRRVSAGSARDHLLGFEAVSGRGERFRAGAKVVKNVTGYDLPKLLCGSWGRLAVLTEVTLKVLPRPPQRLTLLWRGLEDAVGFAMLREVMRQPVDAAAAAHLPAGIAGEAQTLIRLDGVGPSICLALGPSRFGAGLLPGAGKIGRGRGRAALGVLARRRRLAKRGPALAPQPAAAPGFWRRHAPGAAWRALSGGLGGRAHLAVALRP